MVLGLLGATIFGAKFVSACAWDEDTLRDELETHADIFDLITGQFPHHGRMYYESRVETSLQILVDTPDDTSARNNLAVAYMQLGRYDEAAEELTRLEQALPDRYETISNWGVLEKKRGRYDEAAVRLQQALEIKPEGHLGLGDFYLREVRYMAALEKSPEEPPNANFLGELYELPRFESGEGLRIGRWRAGPDRIDAQNKAYKKWTRQIDLLGEEKDAGGIKRETKEALEAARRRYDEIVQLSRDEYAIFRDEEKRDFQYLLKLIRADRNFADAYVVLGDRLVKERALNLALVSYVRALNLDHTNPREVRRRIENILDYWAEFRKRESLDEAMDRISSMLEASEHWLREFQTVEADLVARGAMPGFERTEAELRRRGVERLRPLQFELYWPKPPGIWIFDSFWEYNHEIVWYIQRLLGLPPEEIDGRFGPATERRLKEFQRDHGLQVDGKVGPKTWDALLAANDIEVP